jgi:hypothetical protein
MDLPREALRQSVAMTTAEHGVVRKKTRLVQSSTVRRMEWAMPTQVHGRTSEP